MNGSSVWNDSSACWVGICTPTGMADQAMTKVMAIVVPVLFTLIIVVGLVGNIVVIAVVFCNKQMRSTTNILITNLAMADLLCLVFCTPFTASEYALPYWPFGDVWCRMFLYMIYVTVSVSIYTLVLLSLDRFLAVVHPVASMSIRTRRKAYLAICCTWTVVLISCIPVIVSHGEIQNPYAQQNYTVCVFLATKGYNFTAFNIPFFLLSYMLPLTTIFVLYLLIMKKLWFGVTSVGQCGVRSRTRVTRLIVVVIIFFALCWSPVQITYFLRGVTTLELTPSSVVLRGLAETLAYFNSCVNPILYAFLSENFRKAFRKLISRSALRACRSCAETNRATVDDNVCKMNENPMIPSSERTTETSLNSPSDCLDIL